MAPSETVVKVITPIKVDIVEDVYKPRKSFALFNLSSRLCLVFNHNITSPDDIPACLEDPSEYAELSLDEDDGNGAFTIVFGIPKWRLFQKESGKPNFHHKVGLETRDFWQFHRKGDNLFWLWNLQYHDYLRAIDTGVYSWSLGLSPDEKGRDWQIAFF